MSDEEQAPGRFADAAPGAVVAALLETSSTAELDDAELVDAIVAAERQIAHLQAIQLQATIELGRRENYAFCGGCEDADPDDHFDHLHHPAKVVASELSPALCWAPRATDTRVALAYELTEDLPMVFKALHTGRIDLRKAETIAETTRVLHLSTRSDVATRAVDIAATKTVRQLRRWLDTEVIAADPKAAQRRHDRGRRERHVTAPTPNGDEGIADMYLTGPAEDLAALYTAVDAAARAQRADRSPDDTRTLDQRRFDILTGLGWTGLELGHLGCCSPTCTTDPAPEAAAASAAHSSGRSATAMRGPSDAKATGPTGREEPTGGSNPSADPRTHDHQAHKKPTGESRPSADPRTHDHQAHNADPGAIEEASQNPSPEPNPEHRQSLNSAPSGRASQRLSAAHGRAASVNVTVSLATLLGLDDSPAHLEGFGPITADVARSITGDATLRRLLTDPADGRLLEFGRTTYAPPRALRDLVIARDRTCRFPSSDIPARTCDIDHRQPWSSGGTTGATNNHTLSRRFHIDKTHHGWTLEQPRPGWLLWRSPAGKTYPVPPEAVGPITHVAPAPPPRPAHGPRTPPTAAHATSTRDAEADDAAGHDAAGYDAADGAAGGAAGDDAGMAADHGVDDAPPF